MNERLGDFKDNNAHSCGRHGLRINPAALKPREDPMDADSGLIPAVFDGFTAWKNGRNGAIAGLVGDVSFKNFKVSDNKLAGIEF